METNGAENQQIKELLEENLTLARENNWLLKGMRRTRWLGTLWRVVWWAFVLISSYYLYNQYLAPYFGQPGSFTMPSQAQIEQAAEQYQSQHK